MGLFLSCRNANGSSIGQHKHFAQTCTVTEELSSDSLINWIKKDNSFKSLSDSYNLLYTKNIFNIFVNGDWIGTHSDVLTFIKILEKKD